jgi:hypothetical protein
MIQTFIVQFKIHDMAGADPGFVVRGARVGEGSGDRLKVPSGSKAEFW